jgi:hypothetical protein
MPGLARAMARTAVVAGTATAASNAVNRRQASKNVAAYDQAYQQQAAAAPPPEPVYAAPAPVYAAPAPAESDMYSQLERLGTLKAQGILTEEEFAAEKAKILAAG